MTLKQHMTITTVLTVLLGFFWKNSLGVLLFWLGGIFVDVDHYFDYVRETGDVSISLRRMEELFLNLKEKKFYGLFHSYELVLIGLLVNFFYVKSEWFYGLLAGLGTHLSLDALFNPVRARFYFFLYRLNHSFDINKGVKQKNGN